MDNLNDVLLFTRVVEQGGFTAAAKVLNLPKSSVSRGVARLEERLGVRLLQRSTRRVQVTEVGRRYYEYCRRAVQELREADSIVENYLAQPSGLLRITAPYILGQALLGDVVIEMMNRYPEVQCQVELSNRYVDLIEEGFDVAIRVGESLDSVIASTPLCRETVELFASGRYLADNGTPQVPKDLHGHTLLDTARTIAQSWTLYNSAEQATVDVSPRLVSNDVKVLLQSAISHQGIVALPKFVAVEAVRTHALKPVLSTWYIRQAQISVVYPSYKGMSPSVHSFTKVVRRHVAKAFSPNV